MDWDRDGRAEIVVAPLKGRGSKGPGFDQTAMRLLKFSIPENPMKEVWPLQVLAEDYE